MYEIKYRKPEEMKDSGVEWLGEIPKDWSITKLKYMIKNYESGKRESYDKPEVLSIGGEHILEGKFNFSNPRYVSYKYYRKSNLGKIKNDDILLVKDGATIGKTMYVSSIDFDAMVNEHVYRIEYSKYGYYVILSNNTQTQFWMKNNSTAQESINSNTLKNIDIVKNNYIEQQKIANFLDIKTSEFDSIISKKEKLIEKLEEAKKSLISEVVTGKVKIVDGELVKRQPEQMKDSGVEWLGMIPKDWEVKRVKNLFSLRNERNYKSMDKVQILSLYTSLGVKRQEDIENKTGNVVRTVHDYKLVYPKDIVVNIILAWMGSIGMSQYKGVISPAYDIYKPNNNINSSYYNYLFRTPKFAGECFKYGRGIMLMRWRTYSDEFMSIYCCCPSESEQGKIVDFLGKRTSDIEATIKKNKLQIQNLKQAKQSLISEAVTGKIDLRDWEIIGEGEE